MRIVFAAGLILLVVAAAALVSRFVPTSNRGQLAAAALSPYLMLGAPLAALGFALARQWTPVAVAAMLTVAVLTTQLPWFIGTRGSTAGIELRVVSANLFLGRADPAAVAGLPADVLAVQELTPELSDALSSILATEFPHSVLRPRDRAAGVGLWSRYPIVSSGSDDSFTRGLVYARIRVPGTDFETTIVATHMPPPRSAFALWRREITRLGPTLVALPADGPVIIGGDLNATPDLYEFRRLLTGGYRDGAAQTGAGLNGTHPSGGIVPPVLAVDHIMTRGATVTALEAVKVSGSDHRALAAVVVLR